MDLLEKTKTRLKGELENHKKSSSSFNREVAKKLFLLAVPSPSSLMAARTCGFLWPLCESSFSSLVGDSQLVHTSLVIPLERLMVFDLPIHSFK